MKITYQAAFVVFVLCQLLSARDSRAQNQTNSAAVKSTVISNVTTVTLSYNNDPPSQETLNGLQKIREAKARYVHQTPVTSAVEGVPLAVPKGPESQAPLKEISKNNSLAPGDYQAYEKKLISSAPTGLRATASEISLAANSNIVFATGNWWAAISFDHGNNWQNVDPFTQFPASDGGFCCDQEVIYDEERDLMIWVMQYINDGDDNRYRIAVARGYDRLAQGLWSYFDIQPTDVGLGSNRWFDYPHVTLGSNRLFLTYNSIATPDGNPGSTTGFIAFDLDDMANASSVGVNAWDQDTLWNFTPAQGSESTYYFASHLDNTTLRVYQWTEGISNVTWDDVSHDPFEVTSRGDATCPDQVGNDACAFFNDKVQVGFLANGELGFGWMVGQGGNFPHPYVRFVVMDASNFNVLSQPLIWSNFLAWIYPSLGVNDRGHFGGTITYVPAGSAPSTAAWIADDYNTGLGGALESYIVSEGTSGPECERWGDYYRSRPHHPYGNTWLASGHTLIGGDGAPCGSGSSEVKPRMVWFGRERDRPVDNISISDLHAVLDGPYIDGSSGSSGTDLNGEIPLLHPYCSAPWNYCGLGNVLSMPSDAVDWVLIRLYAGHPADRASMNLMGEKVGLIKSDGRITASMGLHNLDFSNVWGGKYWIAVYHRNHLGVITPQVENFENGSAIHSFRFNGSYGANSQRSVDNITTMWGGDANGRGSVTAFDFVNYWLPQNGGSSGYWSGDFDLNGEVTAFDFINVWLPANGRASAAPDP